MALESPIQAPGCRRPVSIRPGIWPTQATSSFSQHPPSDGLLIPSLVLSYIKKNPKSNGKTTMMPTVDSLMEY
jgi:hypothetical protein